MELLSLTDYHNVKFSLPAGSNTIGKDYITKEDKEYLLSTFPEWFEETTEEKVASDLSEKLRIIALLEANAAGEDISSNPFETKPETVVASKVVDFVETQESKVVIENSVTKVKTKKK